MQKLIRHPIFLGTCFFSIQLFLILLICPEKNWSQAWLSLAAHWDSEWYEAIAQFGYINIDGPLHTGLRNANVVFFPGYPYLARVLILVFGLNAKVALLLVSQTAALLFWCIFFHIIRQAKYYEQFFAAILVLCFPTSWFLFMGYSESVFILCCCLMLWFATEKRWVLSAISAVLMTATRLIGVPVLIAPLLAMIVTKSLSFKKETLLELSAPCLIAIVGAFGCLGFLLYCAVEFGSWHLYFDMERIGWKGTADPWFLFKLPTWLPPPFAFDVDYAPILPNGYAQLFIFKFFRLAAYTFSETLVPIFLWILIFYSIALFKKNHHPDSKSLSWYFGALLLFLFTCLSLYTRHYESMSRCLYPVWILLIISDVIHPHKVFLFRLNKPKLIVLMVVISLLSLGFWLQMLNRYFLGWWVA